MKRSADELVLLDEAPADGLVAAPQPSRLVGPDGRLDVAPGPLQGAEVAARPGEAEEVVGDSRVLRGSEGPGDPVHGAMRLAGIEAQLGEALGRRDDGDVDLGDEAALGPAVAALRHTGEGRAAHEPKGGGEQPGRLAAVGGSGLGDKTLKASQSVVTASPIERRPAMAVGKATDPAARRA
jgi:hypothetical protein